MKEELWSDMIPDLIRIPFKVYSHRYTLNFVWKKILTRFNLGETNVVVLGRPSVGKSILCSQINGKVTIKYDVPGVSDDVETDTVRFAKWSKIIRVIPGQSSRERERGLNEVFHTHDNLEGVIFVVDYGYTDERSSVARNNLINNIGIDTVEKLKQHNLRLELQEFSDIANNIKQSTANGRGPKWIVIAVNKVDLYFSEIDDAHTYYSRYGNSGFSDIIRGLISFVGEQHIKIITLPICCLATNFRWNTEVIQSNLDGFEVQQGMYKNFINEIIKLDKS